MKKLFVSILALAAFAACQSNFNDVDFDAPQAGSVNVGGSHTIYAEVGVGEETKATYGDDLSALWEENDQIALLQEHADYGKTFGVENKIAIKNGVGTSFASFSGDISVDATAPRIYHIVYPASAAEFNVSSALSKTSDSSYAFREDGVEVGHYYATATFDYTYNSTLNVTVPAAQSGKWEPYMYASTDEAVASTAIGAKTLNTLTGAIAIRAYEADGTTPKQLKSVAVTATQPIAGTFSGSATSVGSLGSVTGPETSDVYSTVSENDILWWKGAKYGREEAEKLLLAKVQGMEPTSTTATKALSLAFVGDQYTVGAEDTSSIAADDNGVYTYHLNVAPFEGADLTVMATAVDGSTFVRTVSAQSLAASHRKGYNFKWENATLTVGDIETWYDNCNTTIGLEGNTLYVNNLEVKGVSADHVLALGVAIDGVPHTASAKSGVLTIDKLTISNVASGTYNVCAYAKVLENGQEKEIKGAMATKNVTAIPEIAEGSYVRSSYSYNGGVKTDNGVGGGDLRVKTVLNDSHVAENLVKSYTFYYNGVSVNPTLGQEHNITLGYDKWGKYDCYVKIELKNGYVIESNKYTTHVTGIPYTMNTSSNDGSWSEEGNVNWNSNGGVRLGQNQWGGAAYIQRSFHIPANVTVKVTANGIHNGTEGLFGSAKVKNTVTLTVGSSKVVEHVQNGKAEAAFSCSSANASMSSSNNTVKINSDYNLQSAKVVLRELTIKY